MEVLISERDALVSIIRTLIAGYERRAVGMPLSDRAVELEAISQKLRLFIRDEFGEEI